MKKRNKVKFDREKYFCTNELTKLLTLHYNEWNQFLPALDAAELCRETFFLFATSLCIAAATALLAPGLIAH